ncbi:hypothetical protein [Endozoicomonas sp. ONNA2]|uniref:hypothetical protein n=1 Tax=Endozoicomonas sp. ONNA2 TaxID=2828741 RepID=UPI002147A0DC|nr:hypothetical protein [Endozoicomonas sp. ONNA2]
MTPLLTSCVTITPPSDSAAADSGHSPERGSVWPGFWNVSKTVAQSFHPGFNPGPGPDQPGGPWIQLKIQPKELALRLVQKAIPANSYLNTINQLAMACLALASLPGCRGQAPPGSDPVNTDGTTTQPGCKDEPIPVQSNADLAKIGKERCYRANGKYEQIANIAADNHSPIHNFNGEYNGNGKRISNLNNCLFLQVKDKGVVRNVVVKYATIISINDRLFYGNKGLIACEASGHSLLKNNTVEHSDVLVRGRRPMRIGMLAGEIRGNSKLEGNQVKHSTMSANTLKLLSASIGILTGRAKGSASLDSNSIDHCQITAVNSGTPYYPNTPEIYTGLMAGSMDDNVYVSNSRLTNNRLEDNTRTVCAGGVAGRADGATVEGTHAINNTLLSQIWFAPNPKIAVVVANAVKCRISDTTAINNHLELKEGFGKNSWYGTPATGIVTASCAQSTIKNTLAEHNKLFCAGKVAVATAYLEDKCEIHNTTARNMIIEARQGDNNQTAAAIAAASFGRYAFYNNKISQTTAINCQISAQGTNGYAAVGAGYRGARGLVTISDTTACNSHIKGVHAGIAAGDTTHPFTRTLACNTTLNARLENPGCAKANCAKESTDAPPTRLNTTATAGSYHTTTLSTSLPSSQMASSAVSSTTLFSSRDQSPTVDRHLSFKTVTATQHQPVPSVTVPSASVNGTDNHTILPLNHDEVHTGIPVPALVGGAVAGILTGGIMLYAIYQWYQGYKQGLSGKELVLRPMTWIRDAICCNASAIDNRANSNELVSLVSEY